MIKFFKSFVNFDSLVIIILIVVFNSKVEFIKAGTIDESFKAVVTNGKYGEDVIPGEITDVKKQPDGKLVIAGSFISYNEIDDNNYIVRIFPDGTLDTSFHSHFQNNRGKDAFLTVFIQKNEGIFVSEDFRYSGKGLNRLFSNGAIDSNFNKNISPRASLSCTYSHPTVNSIIRLNDSLLLLSGNLDEYDSHFVFMAPVIVNNDGELINKKYRVKRPRSYNIWPSSTDEFIEISRRFTDDFYTNYIKGLGGKIVGINSKGNIITLGREGSIKSIFQDGTLDSTFFTIPTYSREKGFIPKDSGLIFDERTTNFVVLKDDKILVCGEAYNKNENNQFVPAEVALVRYLPNGKVDHSFKVDSNSLNVISKSFRSSSFPILEDSDGKIIIGNRRFNQDGSLDDSFLLPFDSRFKIFIESDDRYFIANASYLYKVHKHARINFFGIFSITLD